MKRDIIRIDEEKCNGCGLCVEACHEGALQIIDGKARLISESYCDGLGACLPECPTGAISIEQREAAEFDEAAVEKHLAAKKAAAIGHGGGCPSARAMSFAQRPAQMAQAETVPAAASELRQWPCQIKLVPVNAPFFDGAKLLVAADCTAYAYANMHSRFMKGKVTLIGCPKLDMVDYTEKLTEILKHNDIRSVDVVRMSVPCCGGLEYAVRQALIQSGKMIPWQVTVITPDGDLLED
ncbi:MAG: 4Fe-4S binding protein [Christensenellaceae bacterium]|nr:4Fe-4S binding protein [Christensenellaceae bacterium]